MTFHRCHDPRHTPPKPEDLYEEFDRLLEESSLGTPAAKAIRALTPQEVIDDLQDRVGMRPVIDMPDGDADDVLLALVRQAANAAADRPAAPDATSLVVHPDCWGEQYPSSPWTPATLFLPWHRPTDFSGMAMESMLLVLLERDVFQYVRRDVARSIVDIGLTGDASLLIVEACHAAVIRCGIADDLATYLLVAGSDSIVAELWPASTSIFLLTDGLPDLLGPGRSPAALLAETKPNEWDADIIDAEVVSEPEVAQLPAGHLLDHQPLDDAVEQRACEPHGGAPPNGPMPILAGGYFGFWGYVLDDDGRTRRACSLLWRAGLIAALLIAVFIMTSVALDSPGLAIVTSAGLGFGAGGLFRRRRQLAGLGGSHE
jgi:hypothetical protein